ncbi:MAG: phytase [Sediminicola sp.]
MKNLIYIGLPLLILIGCADDKLPVVPPDIISDHTLNDTDDPAIWINPQNSAESIVFGTDKETNGAIYAFGLDGKIIADKTLRDMQRPNNVDVGYGLRINDSLTTDFLVFTERERQQIRVFSVPDMKALDGGGIPVFTDVENIEFKLPMGIAIHRSAKDGSLYVIVGRKTGPLKEYLYQYRLEMDSLQQLNAQLVRKFGNFSGKKEIEAIAVDDELGFVYFSDEQHCIRKYYADPSLGNEELDCFGGEQFLGDIEGIAIADFGNGTGFLIVSDQQRGQFNIFDRKSNRYIKAVNLGTLETDGCEVVTVPLNNTFKNGLFVAMNDQKNFYFYDLKKLGLEP